MKRAPYLVLGLLLVPACAQACMRAEMDDRAIQWSTAVVTARLQSVGPKVEMGQTQERQGPRGALGTATTTYFYRVYQFEVTDVLDGPLKKGDKVPVIRLFMKTENPSIICSQHLTKSGIGKPFVLLLRPLDPSKSAPTGMKSPDVKGAMIIVHLEPQDQVQPKGLKALEGQIQSVRAAEQQINPQVVGRQITSIKKAADDARAGPSVRALERMGPKVIPTVQAAVDNTSGAAHDRLAQVVADLTPPDLISMLLTAPPPRLGAEADEDQ